MVSFGSPGKLLKATTLIVIPPITVRRPPILSLSSRSVVWKVRWVRFWGDNDSSANLSLEFTQPVPADLKNLGGLEQSVGGQDLIDIEENLEAAGHIRHPVKKVQVQPTVVGPGRNVPLKSWRSLGPARGCIIDYNLFVRRTVTFCIGRVAKYL